jgi:hypothetical protein
LNKELAMPDTPAPLFTPGPWLIGFAETGVRWPTIYVADESHPDGQEEIAEVSGQVARNANRRRLNTTKKRWVEVEGAEVVMANARLIAAAPAMYAALEEALHALHLSEDCQDEINVAIEMVRNALQAVKGGAA